MKNLAMKNCFATLAIALCAAASNVAAAPQTFRSKVETPGSMDEYLRVVVTRDCSKLDEAPYVRCSKQEISVVDKSGKALGKFDNALLPRAADGSQKLNIANVTLINEPDNMEDSSLYFILRFVPQDSSQQDVTGTGQLFPSYYEVVTDAQLKPLKGMRLEHSGAADKWLASHKKSAASKLKARAVDRDLISRSYLEVMPDR